MKTLTAGLIPIVTLKHLNHRFRVLALTILLTGSCAALHASADRWLGMEYLSADVDIPSPLVDELEAAAPPMSCKPSLQVSLNEEGYAVLVPGMFVLDPTFPLDEYEVDIMGPLDDTVFCAQLGQEVMVVVTEIPTGNTCMPAVTPEDKLGPNFICTDDTIACTVDISELDFLSFIDSVYDNCGSVHNLTYAYQFTEFECDPDGIAGRIDISYSASDDEGNMSACAQSVFLEKFPLDSVVFPPDTMLSCANPDTSIQNVGQPTIGGQPIDHFCELVAWRTQVSYELCSGEFKVQRMWNVLDWCTGQKITDLQTIHVKDTIAPVIDCPADDTIGTDRSQCFATYVIPDPDVTDVCSDDDLIEKVFMLSTQPGLFYPGDVVQLDTGEHVFTVQATDDCLTTGTCQYTITVVDDEDPVIVCNNLSTNLNDLGFSILLIDSADVFFSDNCGIDSIALRRMDEVCTDQDTVWGPFVTFCCEDAGDTVMVSFLAIDFAGNEQQCMFEVIVKDATPPDARCKDIMVFLDMFGQASITADSIDDGSTDNCEIVDITIDRDTFNCDDLGPNPVTLTVTDASGNVSTCIGIADVKDTIPPDARCKDITVKLDSTGFAMITPFDVDNGSFDNCLIHKRELSKDTFTCNDVGMDTITLIITDQSGNVDSCTSIIMVMDNPPEVECRDITVFLDTMGMVTITREDIDEIMDDCGIDTFNLSRDKFGCDDLGDNEVVLTVTDIFANTASCTSIVTVVDSMLPECLIMDITVQLDADGMASIDSNGVDAGSNDECGLESITVTPNTFDCSQTGGPVLVTQTVTDNSGNVSTCTANVIVEDNIDPTCLTQDITVMLDGDGLATIPENGVDNGSFDNCGIASITVDPDEFRCGDVGPVEVIQTVTDVNGNTSTCTATVTVEDNLPPECLTQDITVFLDGNGDASIAGNAVDNGSNDNCDIQSITVDPDTFDCDDTGDIEVTQTVTDINGNTSTCTATVTVIDSFPPECTTMDITVMLDEMGTASIPGNGVDDGSDDNCGIESITVTPNTFGCEDAGETVIVTQTVTDVNGNSSSCTAEVFVEDNNVPECVTMDITVFVDDNGEVMIADDAVNAGSAAACGIESIMVEPNSFDCDDIGDNMVVQTVTDASGNTNTCTATVTVQDTTAPECLNMDLTVFLDEDGEVTLADNALDNGSNDNCAIDTITIDPNTFDCDDAGVVVVTQTVTDVNGNSSTCTSNVTVEDTLPPVCLIMDITVNLDDEGMASITNTDMDDGSSDNCMIESIILSQTEFDCTDGDSVNVVQTVTDVNGNSSTCEATVFINNPGGPMAVCNDTTIYLDANGMVSITAEDIDGGSSVNCGDLQLEIDIMDFDCDDIGDNPVVLTVTDDSGQSDSCTATVTVEDTIPPTAIAQDVTVYLDDMGMASVTVGQIDDGSFDNCDVQLSIDPTDFTCGDIGANDVTLTAVDPSGNMDTDIGVVTVLDTIAPICMSVDTIMLILDGQGNASIDADDVNDGSSDNCGSITLEIDMQNFTCDDIGTEIVTLTVTDGSGNTSTCTTVVTIEDGDNFLALCQDITVFLDANGMVSITPEDIDNGSGGGCFGGEVMLSLDIMDFDCEDVGDNTVTLTATDGENTDSCMATVTVVDNIPPMIMCPPDTTIECESDISDPGIFGMATASDNCPGVTIEEMAVDSLDLCGAGTLTRTFTATDASGNTTTCVQVVTLGEGGSPGEDDITFPPDVNLPECSTDTDPEDTGMPMVNIPEGSCAQIGISFEDSISTITSCDTVPDMPCTQIFRKWTVVDTCQLEPGTDNGMFMQTQIITIVDTTGPEFDPVNDITVTVDNLDSCTAFVNLVVNPTDCDGPVLSVENDYNDGGADASDDYPVGLTVVTFVATDSCCNTSTLQVEILVEDSGTPTFECFKPIVCIPAEGELTFNACDFIIFENPDGCLTKDDFFFSYSNTDPFDSLQTWNCSDAGDVPLVPVFTYDMQLNLIDSCSGDLDINDGPPDCPETNCSNPNLTIGGQIFNEMGARLYNMPVAISNTNMPMEYTAVNGTYRFEDLVSGNNYAVTPQKNDEPLEGVTTLDLVAIQKHLLGLKQLDSPYKLIAADIVSNGEITALDLVELRKMLLGQMDAFSSNTSWRFVDADYEFPDPYDPFMMPFPEEILVGELWENLEDADFVGVKIGDVNNTVTNIQKPEIETRSGRLALMYPDKFIREGETFSVPLQPVNFDNVAGYQFEVQFDIDKVQFESITVPSGSPVSMENIGLEFTEQGKILVSWSAGKGLSLDSEHALFEIVFTATAGVRISQVIDLSADYLQPEAYADGEAITVNGLELFANEVETVGGDTELMVLENRPNPFSQSTEIVFNLQRAGEVELLIHSVDGQLVHVREADLPAGIQVMQVKRSALPSAGIYYYTIVTNDTRVTRKMTLLD